MGALSPKCCHICCKSGPIEDNTDIIRITDIGSSKSTLKGVENNFTIHEDIDATASDDGIGYENVAGITDIEDEKGTSCAIVETACEVSLHIKLNHINSTRIKLIQKDWSTWIADIEGNEAIGTGCNIGDIALYTNIPDFICIIDSDER